MSKLISKNLLSQKIETLKYQILRSNAITMNYGSSAYDTGWVARIKNSSGKPVFPKALYWIRKKMHDDYTWGENNHFIYFDRLLSTLSAVNALVSYGLTSDLRKILTRIDIMSRLLRKPLRDPGIAFGLLYPSLLISLEEKTGYDLLHDSVRRKFYNKIDRMDLPFLFSKPNYLGWSAEFLYPLENFDGINLNNQRVQEGSLFGSNSSTAYYSMKTGRSIEYLKKQIQLDGSFSLFSPQRYYNRLWQLLFLSDPTALYMNFLNDLDLMYNNIDPMGITMGGSLPFPDADCTAIFLHLLVIMDNIHPKNPLLEFSEYYTNSDTGFYDSFPVSSKVSEISNRSLSKNTERFAPSVNFHLYLLYKELNTPHARYVIDRLDDAFDKYYKSNSDLPDEKWHTHPSYSHARAIQTFAFDRPDLAEKSLNYFLDSRNELGYWGPTDHFCSEINAYALIGLYHYNGITEIIDTSICDRALNLSVNNPNPTCKLYTGKTTYIPDFAKGAILAALIYGRHMIWRNEKPHL